MEILKIVFIVGLIIAFIVLSGFTIRARTNICSQFGEGVFLGPDGNCYKCPAGFSPETDPKSGTIILNSLNVPMCSMKDHKPMKLLRKTVSPASLLSGAQYVNAEMVSNNLGRAQFHGTSTNRSCPPGTTADGLSNMCYSCPEGYRRTSADINGPGACMKPCEQGEFEGDFTRGETIGKCYKCPSGYRRTREPIDSVKACVLECPPDGFIVNDQCYRCPIGFTKNESALSPDEACYKPCNADGSTNVFEYRESQGCYECPEGYIKDPTQNISPFNSLSCINNQTKPAEIISVVGADGRMVSPTIVKEESQAVENVLV